jgi:hypothetical protein
LASLSFTTTPDTDQTYNVGETVEVFCDHEIDDERVRGWLTGTVVQVDPKMIAVQFRENVYLTDGWMVPDHVLWCPVDSRNIRHPVKRRRSRPSSSKTR